MIEHYQIRKGVPLPVSRKVHKILDLPLTDMEVGDSFTFPPEDVNRVKGAVYDLTKDRSDVAYKVRTNLETGEAGVWRTE